MFQIEDSDDINREFLITEYKQSPFIVIFLKNASKFNCNFEKLYAITGTKLFQHQFKLLKKPDQISFIQQNINQIQILWQPNTLYASKKFTVTQLTDRSFQLFSTTSQSNFCKDVPGNRQQFIMFANILHSETAQTFSVNADFVYQSAHRFYFITMGKQIKFCLSAMPGVIRLLDQVVQSFTYRNNAMLIVCVEGIYEINDCGVQLLQRIQNVSQLTAEFIVQHVGNEFSVMNRVNMTPISEFQCNELKIIQEKPLLIQTDEGVFHNNRLVVTEQATIVGEGLLLVQRNMKYYLYFTELDVTFELPQIQKCNIFATNDTICAVKTEQFRCQFANLSQIMQRIRELTNWL